MNRIAEYNDCGIVVCIVIPPNLSITSYLWLKNASNDVCITLKFPKNLLGWIKKNLGGLPRGFTDGHVAGSA